MKARYISLLFPFLLVACGKLNQENYDKLSVGMSQEEVQAIIGSPDNCDTSLGVKSCIWGDEEGKHIKARFMADAAVNYSNSGL